MRDAMARAKELDLLGSMDCDPVTVAIDMERAWKEERYVLTRDPYRERPSDTIRRETAERAYSEERRDCREALQYIRESFKEKQW